jgi:hypothetical protein
VPGSLEPNIPKDAAGVARAEQIVQAAGISARFLTVIAGEVGPFIAAMQADRYAEPGSPVGRVGENIST